MRSVFRGIMMLVVLLLGVGGLVLGVGVATGSVHIQLQNGPAAVGRTPAVAPSATAPQPVAQTAEPATAEITATPAPEATAQAAPATEVATAGPTPVEAAGSTPGAEPPAGTIVEYRVQEGDNLTAIAARFDTTVAAISARNNIENPNMIFVGLLLKIMVGEKSVAQAPEPTATAAPAGGGQPDATATPAAPEPAAPTVTPASPEALEPARPAREASAYEVFIPTASKTGQWFKYTCEFDAAWVVLKTYGIESPLEEQLRIVGVDNSIVPYHKQTAEGVEIYGGDIGNFYAGDYETNFLARSSGNAMRKVFEHYGLRVTPVRDPDSLKEALRAGELVWIKTTVDFKSWVPATWIGPDGSRYKTVLGNDHAVVVAGFDDEAVYIRDVLGPTSTSATRPLEYEVGWPTFLAAWGAQDYDGLAVAPPPVP